MGWVEASKKKIKKDFLKSQPFTGPHKPEPFNRGPDIEAQSTL
jgi:hypothetical protein